MPSQVTPRCWTSSSLLRLGAPLLLAIALSGCGKETAATTSCGPGTTLEGGVCVAESPGDRVCGPGTVLVDGECQLVSTDVIESDDGVTDDDVGEPEDLVEPEDLIEPEDVAEDTAPPPDADDEVTDDDVGDPEEVDGPDVDEPDAGPCPGGCASGLVCGAEGTCVPDPNAVVWKCAPVLEGDGSECNCGCGKPDPDCSDATLPVVGCSSGVCKADGTCGECEPSCDGKACGPDGCGGSCGQCLAPDAGFCQDGACVASCTPDCAGKDCGDDGCGGSCGTCVGGASCAGGLCVPLPPELSCNNYCDGSAPSGCSCASDCLSTGNCCQDAETVCGCLPKCSGRECGDDECGGICGTCGDGESCSVEGQCLDLLCDPDPCGGHGTCSPSDGSCTCDPGFAGANCNQCAPGLVDFPQCVPDQCAKTGQTCSGNGTCQPADGSCVCAPGFGGLTCDRCLDGSSSYPTCADPCAALNCEDPGQCGSVSCPVVKPFYRDCVDAQEQGNTASGVYWIDPDGSTATPPFQVYCDLETEGGGWTMCLTDSGTVHLATEKTYDSERPYGGDGYRANCHDVPFTDVLYVRESDAAVAWFRRDATAPAVTLAGLASGGWSVGGSTLGTFTGHGVANAALSYQLTVCDAGWMWTGLAMTTYGGSCWKACGDWCGDTTGVFFRHDGDFPGGGFGGVAFNENGHQLLPATLVSVGIRSRAPAAPKTPGVGGFGEVACLYLPTEGACDDGQLCTSGDVCEAGECTSGPVVCDVAVNAADDVVDGACNAEHCSLREALYVAEASPDATRIGLSVDAPIVLASDLPALTTPTTLLALDETVTLDGAGAYRVLSTSADLTLENLRLANGQAEAGGAILQEGGTLTLQRVSFASNDATGFGGAVMASGQVNATECSFTDNTAALGGGAILVAPSGTLTLARSSLQSNTSADGGALGVAGTATLVNCTLDGNEAETRGGAVSGPGTVTLLHCTLSNNVAPIGSASSATNLDALNTVFYTAEETGPLCEVQPVDTTGSLATGPSCGDDIVIDFPVPPELVTLPVGTMVTFGAGPFLDAADPLTCEDPRLGGVDQSGVPRPQGPACDVGAFELYDGFTAGSP